MKRWIHNNSDIDSLEDISCMSDVRGKNVKVEPNIPFSFYYSSRNSSHGPRVKITSDPNKIRMSKTGDLRLTGDWEYTPSNEGDRISSKDLKIIKNFFRKYLVLFLLVWEGKVEDEPSLGDYLEGDISLDEFIQECDFYIDYKQDLDQLNSVAEFEDFCRKYNLVNFYGNN